MIKFSIRDDDTSFFTKPEELEYVYGEYWGKIPISLSVVPFSVPYHKEINFDKNKPIDSKSAIEDNIELVSYLKQKVRLGQVEIMLHGYSHQYKEVQGKWVGEFGWKSKEQLYTEVKKGKEYLERIFDCSINTFTPPSNKIGIAGIKAIRSEGLNLSGIMGVFGDRPFSISYMKSWFFRWAYRVIYRRPYPWVLSFGKHKELVANTLSPIVTKKELISAVKLSIKTGAPFVLSTHYWEIKNNEYLKAILDEVILFAEKNELIFSTVSECFEEERKSGIFSR